MTTTATHATSAKTTIHAVGGTAGHFALGLGSIRQQSSDFEFDLIWIDPSSAVMRRLATPPPSSYPGSQSLAYVDGYLFLLGDGIIYRYSIS